MLRHIAPKGLFARTMLIVTLPVFLMQGVVTYVFFARHWEVVTGNLAANVAGDIALVTRLYEQAAGPFTKDQIKEMARDELGIAFRYDRGAEIPERDRGSVFTVLNNTIDKELSQKLPYNFWYNTTSYPAYVEIRQQLPNGVLVFFVPRERIIATNGYIFVLWMIGATLLLGYVTWSFMRNQVRSIQRLAQAAEAFGRGRDMPDFKPTGATEVRQAGRAFMAMRQRIERHLRQRTEMLAGVSHDLRTPLTRIKLVLAMQDENEDLEAVKTDVEEMERMLEEYLAFARNQVLDETEVVELRELVQEIASDIKRGGGNLTVDAPHEISLDARRSGMKRAISNLVSNAIKHAAHYKLSLRLNAGNAEIIIDDDGPGIDPENYEAVFKAFSRLDQARSQNTAGVGLGLTVVRDIARAHGGEIILEKSPLGGLRAILRIPV